MSADREEGLFVPRGFAHGFSTLEPDTTVAYKVDNFNSPPRDSGIIFNDPQLAIDWPVAIAWGCPTDFVSPFKYQ